VTAISRSLDRLFKPKTIAVVGLSNNSRFADFVAPTLASGAEVFVVNPKHPTVLGRSSVPSLSALDRPIDAVASFMSAERTTELVEEAASLDVGGMVLIAARFAEADHRGAVLQERIRSAAVAARMPVIGPNGLGYINVRRGISLTIAAHHKRRPGGLSIVSQSGAMLSGIAMAAWQHPGFGLNILVSSGNEAVTDLADYVGYLAVDPDTTSIGLVIEEIRRPEIFFAAVRCAVDAGKPIVALKLGRRDRSREMAISHTAAVAGDTWTYEVALRQAGVGIARDPEELVDRLAIAEQVPRERWSAVEKLGVVSTTGGFASLTYDLASEEGLEIPRLESLGRWVSQNLPGVTVPNPLDATGLGIPIWPEIIEKYVSSDELDAILVIHPVADEDEIGGTPIAVGFAKAADQVSKPCVLSNCSGPPGDWVKPLLTGSVALGTGIRPTLRGLHTLGSFVRYRMRAPGTRARPAKMAPPSGPPIALAEGRLVPFDVTMRLLVACGIPIAPWYVAPDDRGGSADLAPGFEGPYVAKLANVIHRTEYGAIRSGVAAAELATAVAELQELASREHLPRTVVIQPLIRGVGETFIGIDGAADVGPLVVFGLGGIYVESIGKVGGRVAPFSVGEAMRLLHEFRDLGVMHGARGQEPWNLAALAEILVSCGLLAVSGADWIRSLDINPMIYGADGYAAVDAVLLLQ